MAVEAALFDVDGTLVDTNYEHALAWFLAFEAADKRVRRQEGELGTR